MMWPTDYAGPYSGVATYTKAEVALHALGAVVGDSAVRKAFANYAVQWKYEHASPWDFFMSMNKSLGKRSRVVLVRVVLCDEHVRSIDRVGDDTGSERCRHCSRQGRHRNAGHREGGFHRFIVGNAGCSRGGVVCGFAIKSVTLNPENRFQDLDTANNVWPASK
ncbi:MAG: hypothetical protein ABJC63_04165 [Gemmatimonadales bacterium]